VQKYYELDKNSTQAIVEANFDPETLVFTYRYDGDMPKCYSVPDLHGVDAKAPGPYEIKLKQ